MSASTTLHLIFRFLLSLATRLRQSVARIVLALRARFASLWRSILTFARPRERSQIRLNANDVPVVGNNPTKERFQISECAKVEEDSEDSGTLAVPPVHPIMSWEDKLSKYQAPTELESHTKPASPERVSQRYKPRTFSWTVNPPDLPAGRQRLLSTLPPPPDGWRRQVHPEGNVFFYHEELRIFTESDVSERGAEILARATTLIQQAIQLGEKTNDVNIMDDLTEIVLNVDDSQRWYYYFVDHRHRLLFWVHPVKLREDLGTDVQGISEYNHIRYLVEAQYCFIMYDTESRSHCEYYPHNRTLPKGVFGDLEGMLNYARTEMVTTASSSSPFTQDELAVILDLVNSLKDNEMTSDSCSIWVISRLMVSFTENQFLNFYGQPGARLNADTPLFWQPIWAHGKVFKIISVFLFGSPNEYAVRLHRVWVDGIVIRPRWKSFIDRLTTELGRYTLLSTVMLAVNFGFLAVPGVAIPGSPASQIEIIIYGSVVSTIGSIVFTFTLLNVYSNPGFMEAGPAAVAMQALGRTSWGMPCLAIMHSVPAASLLWSTTLFSTALAIQIFGPKDSAAVVTLGIECLVLILFWLLNGFVMHQFCVIRDQEYGVDRNDSDEKISTHRGSQYDVEEGLDK